MQKGFKKILLSIVVMLVAFSIFGIKSYAAEAKYATTLNGVDYSAVYDYDYYTTHNPDIKQAYGGNDAAVLNHFVTYGMTEGRQAIQTFDVKSYKLANPDLRAVFGKDLKSYYIHYIYYGKSEGRKATGVTELVGSVTRLNGVDYSAVYDYKYYTNQYPDIKQTFGNDDIAVLNHFVTTGMAKGLQASANFDVSSYRKGNPDLRAAFGNDLKSYYMHYVKYGKAEGRKATGITQLIGAVTKACGVDYSAVYDYKYYTNQYSDMKQAFEDDDIAALNHFVTYGMAEGRQAVETFDVKSYKLANPDLRAAFGKNLKYYYLHYINYGKSEGRKATGVTELVATTKAGGIDYSAVYNYKEYITNYSDIANLFRDDDIAALNHFITYGMTEGRQANANFDVSSYKKANPDLREAFGKNLKYYYLHYIDYGKVEGRKAAGVTQLIGAVTKAGGVDYSSVYDYKYYMNQYSDMKQAFEDDDIAALNHFITYGMTEGRQANADFNVLLYEGNYWDLQDVFGSKLKNYYLHYLDYGKSEGRTGKSQIHNYIKTVTTEGVIYTCSLCHETHKVKGTILGIDVSSHQGVIDWQKVKDSGIEFAIIRCGYGDDLTNQDDTYFERNVQECERLGISWGTYLYSYAKTVTGPEASAESEYQHILRLLQGKHPTLPVYIDMEETTGGDYVAIANYICSKLKSSGYNSGVYANLYWWDNILNNSCFNNYEKWVAQYYTECQYDGAYRIWQYASDGKIPGTDTKFDMDVLFS